MSNFKETFIVKKEEINLTEIVKIIYRRKYLLIISVIFAIALAYAYNSLVKPVYEASVLLKKENDQNNTKFKELTDIVFAQSGDEIATEMEIVKTQNVLKKVIEELSLNLFIEKIEIPGNETLEIEKGLLEFQNDYIGDSYINHDLPRFLEVRVTNAHQTDNYYIKKFHANAFGLYNTLTDELLQSKQEDSVLVFSISSAQITLKWPSAVENSRVYFCIENILETISDLENNISIDQLIKTNIFKINVRSSSPRTAQLLANTVTDKFREIRSEQQKRNIRYSFEFADKQLHEMSDKLKKAEDELSKFKSEKQIVAIDEKSKDLVLFLSNLESEEIKADLELRDYRAKFEGLKDELAKTEYFDQTFLTPQRTEEGNSPFSTLLSQLSDIELKRLDLLKKRTENHPEVSILNEQIKQIKARLSNFNQNTLTSYSILINAIEDKKAKLNSLINQYEKKIELLPAKETRLAELLRQKNVYEKIFNLLLDEREAMRMAELSKLQDIVVVDQAREPLKPVLPRKLVNMVAGMLFGIVLGLVAVFVTEIRNKKILNLDEVERDFHFPILGIIPNYSKDVVNKIAKAKNYNGRIATLMNETEGITEAFRVLKTKVATILKPENKVIMITSCEENTGKTSVSSNLAVTFALSRKKVLLVDCDLRRANLTKAFDIPKDTPGLIQFLTQKGGFPNIYNAARFKDRNQQLSFLDILPAGGVSDFSASLLSSDRMNRIF